MRWWTRQIRQAVVASLLGVALLTAAYALNVDQLFRHGNVYQKLIALGGAAVFTLDGMIAVRGMARVANDRAQIRMSISHAAAIRLLVLLAGYICVAVLTLNTLGVNLGQLLVGGALTGVIVGIAAQQSLGNVFAGLVLVTARPFAVGDDVIVHSGALGGPHQGKVVDMGLVYVTLESPEGTVRLPNSAVLNSAVGPGSDLATSGAQDEAPPPASPPPPAA